jgi:hypothetical protein
MFKGKVWAVVLAAVLAFLACAKKKSKTADEYANVPQVATAKDTVEDIFDEFYTEEKAREPEPAAPAYSSGTPGFVEGGRYVVQVSCVRSSSFAEKLRGKLQEMGYPAYVSEVQNPTPDLTGTYYRVRIGGFAGVSAAKAFGAEHLLPAGYEYWVDNKSNDNVGMEGYGFGSTQAYDTYEPSPSSYSSPTTSYESSTSSYTTTPSTDTWGSSSGTGGGETQGSSSSWESAPAAESTPAAADDWNTPAEESTPAAPSEPQPPAEPSGTASGDDSQGTDSWGNDSTASETGW